MIPYFKPDLVAFDTTILFPALYIVKKVPLGITSFPPLLIINGKLEEFLTIA